MFILLEYGFIVMVRKGTHILANHMSRIPNGEALVGVEDDFLDTSLFLLEIVLEWAEEIYHYLANGLPQTNHWTK